MIKKRCRALAFGAAMMAGISGTFAGPVVWEVGPNLVTNGGFETGDLTGWTTFDINHPFVDCDPASARTGSCSFAGSEVGSGGYIVQDIPTDVGESYNIHLWLANSSAAFAGNGVVVVWNSFVYTAFDIEGSGYQEIVIDPVATSTSSKLKIGLLDARNPLPRSIALPDGRLHIDDIAVRKVSATASVPEPASFALVLTGIVLLLLSRRSPK